MYAALPTRTVVSMFQERSETMDGMKTWSRLAALVLTAAATFAAAACAGGGGEDKAGGTGPTVILRLANTGGSIDQTPAVEYFVKRVKELSGGNVRIEVVDRWARFASNAEQQVVRDVARNDVDLGWVGTRVFDTMGVKSFQALTAPMLIDSYALENAVIESGITDEMMEGLDEVEVVGLAVLADGLRNPIGVTAPILGSADWRGITFGTLRSNGQAEAIRALGATPAQIFGSEREEALRQGTIQGFEFSTWLFSNPMWTVLAHYVTANVILWPQMDVVLANPARLEELTAEQRGWLAQAARDAEARSAALADKDAQAIRAACGSGARFAEASAADLAALEAAFAPVYAKLSTHSQTRAFIGRIQGLKESTPEPALSIPSDCTGEAPKQASAGTGTAPARLNGTYRYELTKEDARKAGDPEAEVEGAYPQVITVTLRDGQLEGGCFGAYGGSYWVKDDRITFDSVEYDPNVTVTFSVDNQGQLHLTAVPPIDPGAAFQCFYKPWTKID
jgi:TRAP-type C4-dicarboxylate transport system substrate-binding protein